MKKKSNKIVLIVIIILFLILVGGGAFAYTYFFTDVFKSNKEMFFTYASENSSIIELLKQDERLKAYSEKQKNTPYTVQGTLRLNDNSGTLDLNNTNITISGNSDNVNKYKYTNLTLNYSNTESISAEYINSGDYYGIRMRDVLDRFIVFENNNLKEFFTKMGLDETQIANIPDKIDLSKYDYSNIILDTEYSELMSKYTSIILNNLTDDMFAKNQTDEGIIYTLTITQSKAMQIFEKILEEFKTDAIIIDKAKRIMKNDLNMTDADIENYILKSQDTIQEMIDGLKYQYSSEMINEDVSSDSQEDSLKINVYVNDKKLIKTELATNETNLLSLTKTENGFTIELDVSEDLSLHYEKTSSEDEIKYLITASQDNIKILDFEISFTGLNLLETVNESFNVNVNISNQNIGYKYTGTKKFTTSVDKETFEQKNRVVLNTATNFDEIMQKLITPFAEKFVEMNEEKKERAGIQTMTEPITYFAPAILPYTAMIALQDTTYLSNTILPIGTIAATVAMISGDNSILMNAQGAGIRTSMAGAQEQIELEIMATRTEYYKNVYENGDTTELYEKIKTTIDGIDTDAYEGIIYQVVTEPENGIDGKIRLTYKDDTSIYSIGTISNSTGSITWEEHGYIYTD